MTTPHNEPLGVRVAKAMYATTGAMPRTSPAETRAAYEADARAAREVLAAQLTAYADSLLGACQRLGHKGAVPESNGRPAKGCRLCQPKVKHMREAAAIIAPDR